LAWGKARRARVRGFADVLSLKGGDDWERVLENAIRRRLEGKVRLAVNSFQIGLSHGIAGKLKTMKAERDAANKTSSGRDLVPLKTSVIDDELTKLGLSFQAKSRARRKRVLVDAYEAGQVAGRRFEVRAGIETAIAN
jgi:hypothetical protein